jgi:hypothetical protein
LRKQILNILWTDWLNRCKENLNFDLLTNATFLDPRFKIIVLESDDEEEPADDVVKELENYLKESKLSGEADPLKDFWKLKAIQYPKLSILARKYLGIQATSTSSKRVFSKMGNVVTKKRNRITPAHTNATIFLSSVL